MFTGLVTDIGEIVAVRQRAEGLRRLEIACSYPRASVARVHRLRARVSA